MSLFESKKRIEKLENLGDPLIKMNELIDFEIYRDDLESMYKSSKEKGGRPPYDPIKMLKILILQRLYNLSDRQTEFQINDRASFQRFLGIGAYDSLPDEKTIWLFKERLIKEGLDKILFDKLKYWIKKSGFILNEGAIVDASIIQVPIQRNTAEENEVIKENQIPEGWEENNRKFAQKDTDARWTLKNNKSYYGYKNHIIVDVETKIIRDYEVTSASVHDSQVYEELVAEVKPEEVVFADSAYSGEELKILTKNKNAEPLFCMKGRRNKPLTKVEQEWNRCLSKIRCRVEHVFGDMKSFGMNRIRSVGMERAKLQILLGNMLYNIRRTVYLKGVNHA
jgi:IS5 family transposase